MLNPGTFYVITIGKRYLRHYTGGPFGIFVGQQVVHARRFETDTEAVTLAFRIRDEWGNQCRRPKPVGVQKIVVSELTLKDHKP
jgi:hypothetical protein